MSIGQAYLSTAIARMKYYKSLGDKTIEQLSDQELHFQPNEASNSIAVIMQHIAGNMLSRWTNFLTEDGEKEWRNRDGEFEPQQSDKASLVAYWDKGWNCFLGALESLSEDDLLKTILIRNEPMTAIDAINRQMAHYPYHIGQMIYAAKILKNNDWQNLSIPKGQSAAFNAGSQVKDPAKEFGQK